MGCLSRKGDIKINKRSCFTNKQIPLISGKKRGRYSHQQRTEMTEEIQKLEIMTKVSEGMLLDEDRRCKELEASLKVMTDMFMSKPANRRETIEAQRKTEEKYMVRLIFL